jgi:hypothetical protein
MPIVLATAPIVQALKKSERVHFGPGAMNGT